MTKAKTQKFNELYPFIDMVASMHDKRVFDVPTLRRKITPYAKTWASSGEVGLKSITTGDAVRFVYEPVRHGVTLVTIRYSTRYGEGIGFEFFVTSNKHFLKKLIKHNLLT
jgi:hypothetical protein